MSDLENMTTQELCRRILIEGGSGDLRYFTNETILKHAREAARRLARYAPVKIDPRDPETWPPAIDAQPVGPYSTPSDYCIEIYEDGFWHRFEMCDLDPVPQFEWWRRINNEEPQ